MSANQERPQSSVTFRMHPRAIAALGKDLVTNDVVAVIELVKNAYDALATRVDVRFRGGSSSLPTTIEVADNGHGMSRRTLEDVWCVVATPFRKDRPEAQGRRFSRKVTGDKGLGRLSAARLGSEFELVTKSRDGNLLQLRLDWDHIASAESLEKATFTIEELASDPDEGIERQGTRIRISNLRNEWTKEKLDELRENLARLVSPFSTPSDFSIYLAVPDGAGTADEVEVESPRFLDQPKYAIRGTVDPTGNVHCKYEYRPLAEGDPRTRGFAIPWKEIARAPVSAGQHRPRIDAARCGPFEFEIRAWDLSAEDTSEMHERFDMAKSAIRDAIRAHKGLSLYRDDILVLPKSDEARDWLGLDLRRVSRVGQRLSTSQIVGYVRITKATNPKIEDTSDREGLASSPAVTDFRNILLAVIYALEGERAQDRRSPRDEEATVNLFAEITAEDLLAEMGELADDDVPVADAMPVLEDFGRRLENARSAIEKRFTYYSRLATVGTIAQLLIHEIRNRTTVIGRTLKKLAEFLRTHPDEVMTQRQASAAQAVDALERLADRFAPLASRSFQRGRRVAVLEDSIERTLEILEDQIRNLGVHVQSLPPSTTGVKIDPGELDSILLNLVSNSLHWLAQVEERRLDFNVSPVENSQRIRIHVDDSGPGIEEEDAERIFWPGVTRKPGGIGMGLTVASELVAEHGGKMALVRPGRLGGASFHFDLPLKA